MSRFYYRTPKGVALNTFLSALREDGWSQHWDHEQVCYLRKGNAMIEAPASSKDESEGDDCWTTGFTANDHPLIEALVVQHNLTRKPTSDYGYQVQP